MRITKRINVSHIYEEGELQASSTVRKFRTVQQEGLADEIVVGYKDPNGRLAKLLKETTKPTTYLVMYVATLGRASLFLLMFYKAVTPNGVCLKVIMGQVQ